jgi:hypothetical protein
MEPIRYGELNSEKIASENETARKIVTEINQFGVNDRQRWMIMYLLGLELEKMDESRNVVQFVLEHKKSELFVSDTTMKEDDGQINE